MQSGVNMAVLGKNGYLNLNLKEKFLVSSSLGWLEICSVKVRERRVHGFFVDSFHVPSSLLLSATPAVSGAW